MSDLISREAAIYAVSNLYGIECDCKVDFSDMVAEAINKLPCAEPSEDSPAWETIATLSDLRSEYNCFDEDEEPKYRALSEAIAAVREKGGDME